MADLPKVTKDADDLSKPTPPSSWRRTLLSALTAVAASVAVGSVSAPPAHASTTPTVSGPTVKSPSGAAKLVFQRNVGNTQAADHYSHESHYSHASHASHYSHYSGFQP
jgi:hypothetical protein